MLPTPTHMPAVLQLAEYTLHFFPDFLESLYVKTLPLVAACSSPTHPYFKVLLKYCFLHEVTSDSALSCPLHTGLTL